MKKAAAEKAAVEKAVAVAVALGKGDWKAVLTLDSDNSEGLRLKAAAEKAAAVTSALAKGDWKAVLELDPSNSDGIAIEGRRNGCNFIACSDNQHEPHET